MGLMLEGVPISSGGQQAYHPNAEPHHRLHSAEDPHEKAPPGAGLSSLRGLAEMRVNGKPTDTISQKAPPGSGAKFGRSIVMGLPGRWQTHPLNTEPNRWFLCRKSQHEKSPAEAGLSRGSHQRACRAGKPTNSTARLTVGCNSPQGYRKKPRRSGAKSLILAFQTGLPA